MSANRRGRIRALRWLPFMLFCTAVSMIVVAKYACQAPPLAEVDAEQVAEDCAVVCERLTVCGLEFFGDTPENRARLPRLRQACLVGCAKPETYVRIQGCFAAGAASDCARQAQCAMSVLYAP